VKVLRLAWPWVAAVLLVLPRPGLAAECGATLYECALFRVGRHEFEEAIRLLDEQTAAAPRDLKALNLLGIALTGAGRTDAANARFQAALAIDPAFSPALRNLAVNEYEKGRYAPAREHFERVLKLAPADEVAHVYLGELESRAKRPAAAAAHYEKAGQRAARDPVWTLHYGQALLAIGRGKEAVDVLDRLSATDAASRFEAAAALGRAGQPAEAARFFASARKGYKDPYAAGYDEALMRIEAGDADGAIRVVQEMSGEGRLTGELLNLVSQAYLKAGRIEAAYDALRQATRLDPAAPENYIDLAMICVEHDNFDLGLEITDIGLGQLPDSWRLHLQRGVLLAMKGTVGEAEKEFDAARRLAPGEAVPYAALGMAWIQSGQADKAVDVLRAELPRRNDHVVPYIFAVALLRSGVEAASPAALEAVEALRRSIRANPRFAPAYAELGKLLLKRDDVEAAIAELETAAELDPTGTPALYALSQAYRKKGDRDKAQALLARVTSLNAAERGDDPDGELRRAVVRIVREGTAPPARPPAEN
jgi:tetratricopeptide (TPR) repeat protein